MIMGLLLPFFLLAFVLDMLLTPVALVTCPFKLLADALANLSATTLPELSEFFANISEFLTF